MFGKGFWMTCMGWKFFFPGRCKGGRCIVCTRLRGKDSTPYVRLDKGSSFLQVWNVQSVIYLYLYRERDKCCTGLNFGLRYMVLKSTGGGEGRLSKRPLRSVSTVLVILLSIFPLSSVTSSNDGWRSE